MSPLSSQAGGPVGAKGPAPSPPPSSALNVSNVLETIKSDVLRLRPGTQQEPGKLPVLLPVRRSLLHLIDRFQIIETQLTFSPPLVMHRKHAGCTNDSLRYFKSLRGEDYGLSLQVTRAFAFAFLVFGLLKARGDGTAAKGRGPVPDEANRTKEALLNEDPRKSSGPSLGRRPQVLFALCAVCGRGGICCCCRGDDEELPQTRMDKIAGPVRRRARRCSSISGIISHLQSARRPWPPGQSHAQTSRSIAYHALGASLSICAIILSRGR